MKSSKKQKENNQRRMSALVLNRYNGGIEIGKSPAAFDKI
jgi:hypothetical protein